MMNDTSIQLLKSNLSYQREERDRLIKLEQETEERLTRIRVERRHCEVMICDLTATLENTENVTTCYDHDEKDGAIA